MSTSLKWTKVKADALPRSSHSISLIDNKAYLYGGEINPREPVDGAVHRVDLDTGAYERIEGKGDIPQSRVGHIAGVINGDIYVFGGRGGPDMTPLDEAGAVHAFSPATSTWSKLLPSSSAYPGPRSYHAGTASPTHLIVHAGCGDAASGRLKDTWLFDIASKAWSQAPEGPGDPRGGTAITYSDGKVWRNGGFNGKTELGGAIDYLNLGDAKNVSEAKWETVSFGETTGLSREDETSTLTGSKEGPGPRSVHALLPLASKLVTFFGEGKPSPTGGHDTAGNFWPDVWSFDPETGKWEEIEVQGEKPKDRGWFAATQAEGKVLIWGGIDAKNERLPDGWVLSAN